MCPVVRTEFLSSSCVSGGWERVSLLQLCVQWLGQSFYLPIVCLVVETKFLSSSYVSVGWDRVSLLQLCVPVVGTEFLSSNCTHSLKFLCVFLVYALARRSALLPCREVVLQLLLSSNLLPLTIDEHLCRIVYFQFHSPIFPLNNSFIHPSNHSPNRIHSISHPIKRTKPITR